MAPHRHRFWLIVISEHVDPQQLFQENSRWIQGLGWKMHNHRGDLHTWIYLQCKMNISQLQIERRLNHKRMISTATNAGYKCIDTPHQFTEYGRLSRVGRPRRHIPPIPKLDWIHKPINHGSSTTRLATRNRRPKRVPRTQGADRVRSDQEAMHRSTPNSLHEMDARIWNTLRDVQASSLSREIHHGNCESGRFSESVELVYGGKHSGDLTKGSTRYLSRASTTRKARTPHVDTHCRIDAHNRGEIVSEIPGEIRGEKVG